MTFFVGDSLTYPTTATSTTVSGITGIWFPDPSPYINIVPLFTQEAVVVKKGSQYIVVRRGTGSVVAAEDSYDEALSAASRLAAKDGEEYFVYRPSATVRQKPVDIEVVTPK